MDGLPSDSEPIGYPLKSPTFLPQPGDGCVLSGIDLRVRMGMFEEESTRVVLAIFGSTGSRNDAEHLATLASVDGFTQSVKRAVWAIEPSDLL